MFNHTDIETKWKSRWNTIRQNSTDVKDTKKKFFNLMMFPYPSAEGLHVGNMYAFTGADIFGRYKRMCGFNVFEPIGLDGFGIHSENFALKIGRHPMDHALVTQKKFYAQLHKIGAMYDWDKTLETYDPDYYRFTQWLFVEMFKHGLAYRKRAEVNFCPGCKTVLADEQVIDGKCERCGNNVTKRSLEQWFFRITAYAEKLLENIPALHWSHIVKTAQTNWIGKKEGINITYKVVNRDHKYVFDLICFTTRPDTNFGATFVALSPEHEIISQILTVINQDQSKKIKQYIKSVSQITSEERAQEGRKKTGVFTGLYCQNDLNGKLMPVYISDFVLMGFGSGAVVGVPGHDKRDFEFAREFDIPVIRVVKTANNDGCITHIDDVQEDEGIMMNSGFLNGMDIHKATAAMMDHMEKMGWGKRVSTYHLRDWLISRQRYWGPPIPMIFCKYCFTKGITYSEESAFSDMAGWFPVPNGQLPVLLPRIEDYRPGDDSIAPLAKHTEFYEVKCPHCGGDARRETDVSDTFLDSSWYFLRYPSLGERKKEKGKREENILPWDQKITKKWLPVDMYTGGAEHSVLHLMYSRFVTMALHDWGYLDFEEPFPNFFAHGLVIKDGAKMSKSKGNVVNPDQYIDLYGSDALRLYLMFMGPFSQGGDFRDSAMEGMKRWVNRVWNLSVQSIDKHSQTGNAIVEKALQKLIKKVGDDIEARHYNTAIASMMEWTNLTAENGGIVRINQLSSFVKLLAPFAPFVTEEICEKIHASVVGGKWSVEDSIHRQKWPEYDEKALMDESVQIVVQVNGKLRDVIEMGSIAAKNRLLVEQETKSLEKIKPYLSNTKVRKIIFVPGKLINFVI